MSLIFRQAGYMLEVPMVLMLVGIILAILLPLLPPIWGKALVIGVGLLVIAGLYYMIVIPGWQPGNRGVMEKPYNLIMFALSVAMVVSAVIGFVVFT